MGEGRKGIAMNKADNDVKSFALPPITTGMRGIKYPYGLTLLASAEAFCLALVFTLGLSQNASAAPQSNSLPFAQSNTQTAAIQPDSMATVMMQSAERWISVKIQPGDRLANVFAQLGLDAGQLEKVMALGGEAAKLVRAGAAHVEIDAGLIDRPDFEQQWLLEHQRAVTGDGLRLATSIRWCGWAPAGRVDGHCTAIRKAASKAAMSSSVTVSVTATTSPFSSASAPG